MDTVMQIPNIGFSYESTEQAEFEIIDMAKVYRSKGYDHDTAAPHRVSFFMMIWCIHIPENCFIYSFVKWDASSWWYCLHAKIGRNDHRGNAPYFMNLITLMIELTVQIF